jgi:hypothetical protein
MNWNICTGKRAFACLGVVAICVAGTAFYWRSPSTTNVHKVELVGPVGTPLGISHWPSLEQTLGTRNRLPGDITVSEVINSQKLFYCCPDGDVHVALQQSGERSGRCALFVTVAYANFEK